MTKTISSFRITSMKLSGFKCYAEPTEFTFGSTTVVTGGNGRGKSSIADAIAFAIMGLPFFGERGIDKMHSEQTAELSIALRFEDENGQPHELTRTRHRERMTISYDGCEVRQRDLFEMFGEKDLFLSIFNPLYFIEELGDGGKKLLERYLPAIPQSEVLAQCGGDVREALKNEKILSPEAYLKKLREDIREGEQTVVYLTGQKDMAVSQAQQAKGKTAELRSRLAALTGERETLLSKRFEGMDVADVQEKLLQASSRYDEMAKEGSLAYSTAELDDKLAELHQKLSRREAEKYFSKYTQPIAEASAAVKELGARYNREAALLKGFKADVICPTCRRAVTQQDLPSVQIRLRQSTEAIVAQGKAEREKLCELNALDKQAEEVFLRFQKEDVQKLGQEAEELTRQRERLTDEHTALESARIADMDKLREQIQNLSSELEFGSLSQDEYERLNVCCEEMRACQAELDAVAKTSGPDSAALDEKIAAAEKAIADKKVLLRSAALYMSKKAEMTFSALKMNKVDISLYDVVKSTGEVKDAFRFTFNGRRYDRLSLSEKIRAGMELSELMKRLSGRNYPVFIDNMESVDDLANVRPTGQVIMAKCVHGAELSVCPLNQPQLQKAA